MSLVIGLWLTACARHEAIVDAHQLHGQTVQSTPYRHQIWLNQAAHQPSASGLWHIYIEGDGRAVDARGRPSLDPTPRRPLMLSMMAEDPAPALYLGRPCYFHTQDPLCSALNWSLARYSEDTVASMVAALASTVPPDACLILIGHSGGGTLAALMAARLNNARGLVTMAGNLNVSAWTQHHGYSPLTLSLDPSEQPPLPNRVRQFHVAGAQDTNILPNWIKGFAERQPNAHFQALQATDHQGPWPPWWTLVTFEPTIKTGRCDKVPR